MLCILITAPCPANFCNNGGICYQPDIMLDEYACDCLGNFRGDRCEESKSSVCTIIGVECFLIRRIIR